MTAISNPLTLLEQFAEDETMKIDLHVATQGSQNIELEQTLQALGLKPDAMIDRHVTFLGDVAISACPLIGLHMTKKYDELSLAEARSTSSNDMMMVRQKLLESGDVGYAHLEVTLPGCDMTIKSQSPMRVLRPWPIAKFQPTFSLKNKKWDIHVAVPVDSMNSELEQTLHSSGMYYIELLKIRDGVERKFRIYTIQGLSAPIEGRRLFNALCDWFNDVSAPYVEIKQETYIDMFRVGNPEIVPPTIETVEYLTGQNIACGPTQVAMPLTPCLVS